MAIEPSKTNNTPDTYTSSSLYAPKTVYRPLETGELDQAVEVTRTDPVIPVMIAVIALIIAGISYSYYNKAHVTPADTAVNTSTNGNIVNSKTNNGAIITPNDTIAPTENPTATDSTTADTGNAAINSSGTNAPMINTPATANTATQ